MEKTTKPEYAFEFRIYDKTNDETIIEGGTYVSERTSVYGENESIDMEVSKALRAFDAKARQQYEEENYPPKSRTDTEWDDQ